MQRGNAGRDVVSATRMLPIWRMCFMLGLILGFIVTGLIVGALGRLVVPGRNPIGIPLTIGLGIAGAVAGGVIAHAVGLGAGLAFVISVVVAAVLVYIVSGGARRRTSL